MRSRRIAFLCDASATVGLGHLRRCAALAAECLARGAQVEFWCPPDPADRLLPDWLGQTVERRDGPRPGVDWIVWDVRDPQSAQSAQALASGGGRILALDELGPARAQVSIVVDALMTPRRAARYAEDSRVAYHYGLEYLILDAERLTPAPRSGSEAPLIVFGGSDPEHLGARLIDALRKKGFSGPFTMVAGLHNPSLAELDKAVAEMGGTLLEYTTNLPDLMRTASFVVTKLGGTVFESFAVGAPCVLLEPTTAHEQLAAELRDHYRDWPAWNFGLANPVSIDAAAAHLGALVAQPSLWRSRTEIAAAFAPRQGTRRVADLLFAE